MLTANIRGTLIRKGAFGRFRLQREVYRRRSSKPLYLVSTDFTHYEQPYAVILLSWWYKETELWRPKVIRSKK